MSDRIRVIIADDVDYEDLIAEIQIDGDCVAIVSQEGGELRVEFDQSWAWAHGRKEIPLFELRQALEQAEKSLLKMRKP